MHENEKNNCLRESSRMRTLLACESSEQPSTASMPHIVMIYKGFCLKRERKKDWIKCEEDKEKKKKTRKTRCKECGITNT